LNWPDSTAFSTALSQMFTLVSPILSTGNKKYHSFLGELLCCLLTLLTHSHLQVYHMEIISLIRLLYTKLITISSIPLDIFLSIPNVTQIDLENFNASLSKVDEKKQKQMFKKFLQPLNKGTLKISSSNNHNQIEHHKLAKPSWEEKVDDLAIKKLWENQ